MRDPNQPAPPVAFLHLAIDQPRCYLPPAPVAPSANHLEPLTKVSRESIEVEIEPVTGKERQAARGQALPQRVDEQVCHVLGAGTELKHRKNLGARIDGQPEPEHLLGVAQPGAQFVQLKVRKVEVFEVASVQRLRVLPSASQPGGDGRLPVAEDPFGGGSIQTFGEGRQDHSDLMRGGFQMIQRSLASSSKGSATGLTAKGLDPLGLPMLAIAHQRVDLSIGNPEVGAEGVGTSEPIGVYAFGCSPAAFHLRPGTHRSRRWPCTR